MAKMTTAQVEAKAKEMGITLTSGTYASIAGKHGSSPAAVEKSLRDAAARTSVAQSTQPAAASTAVSSGSGRTWSAEDTAKVTEAYKNWLGRAPTASEMEYRKNAWINGDVGVGQQVRDISQAAEADKVRAAGGGAPALKDKGSGGFFSELWEDTYTSLAKNETTAAIFGTVLAPFTGGLSYALLAPGMLEAYDDGDWATIINMAGIAITGGFNPMGGASGMPLSALMTEAGVQAAGGTLKSVATSLVSKELGRGVGNLLTNGGSSGGQGGAPGSASGSWQLSGDVMSAEQIMKAATAAGLSAGAANDIVKKYTGSSAAAVNASIAYNLAHMGGGGGGEGGAFADLMSGSGNWMDFLNGKVPSLDYASMVNQSYDAYQRSLADMRNQIGQMSADNKAQLFGTPDGVATLSLLNALGTTGVLNAGAAQELNKAIAATYPTYYTDVVIPSVLAQRRSANLGEVYANEVVPSLLKNTQMLAETGYTEAYRALIDPRFKQAADMAMSALPGTVDDRLMTQRLAEQRALQQMYQGVQSSRMLDAAAPGLMATAIGQTATTAALANQQLQGARYMDRIDANGDAMVSRAISIEEQVSESARSMLAGEVPADVAANIERQTAEKMGARSPQVAANMLAKNLGLTSLDLMNQGSQMSQTAANLRSQTPALGLQLWANRQAPITSYTNLAQTSQQMSAGLPGFSGALSAAGMTPYSQALSLANDAAAYGASVPAAMQQTLAPYAQRMLVAQGALDLAGRPAAAFAEASAGTMRPAATGAEVFKLMSNFMAPQVSNASLYTNMLGLSAGATTVSPATYAQIGAGLSSNLLNVAFNVGQANQNAATRMTELYTNLQSDMYGYNAIMKSNAENTAMLANRYTQEYSLLKDQGKDQALGDWAKLLPVALEVGKQVPWGDIWNSF